MKNVSVLRSKLRHYIGFFFAAGIIFLGFYLLVKQVVWANHAEFAEATVSRTKYTQASTLRTNGKYDVYVTFRDSNRNVIHVQLDIGEAAWNFTVDQSVPILFEAGNPGSPVVRLATAAGLWFSSLQIVITGLAWLILLIIGQIDRFRNEKWQEFSVLAVLTVIGVGVFSVLSLVILILFCIISFFLTRVYQDPNLMFDKFASLAGYFTFFIFIITIILKYMHYI